MVWWRMRDDGNLHVEDLTRLFRPRTRLVACTVTSNALGSIVDVARSRKWLTRPAPRFFWTAFTTARTDRLTYSEFGCDYLVCSGYKIFAPHMGFLWGRGEVLDRLPTFREDFIPNEAPMKFEAGTFIYENVAGMDGGNFLHRRIGKRLTRTGCPVHGEPSIVRGMKMIREYEGYSLNRNFQRDSRKCGAVIYGVRDLKQIRQRVPTFCFNLPKGVFPAHGVRRRGEQGIGVRDGHMYAPRLDARWAEPGNGAVRVSLVHYNTVEEVRRFGQILGELARTLTRRLPFSARPRICRKALSLGKFRAEAPGLLLTCR